MMMMRRRMICFCFPLRIDNIAFSLLGNTIVLDEKYDWSTSAGKIQQITGTCSDADMACTMYNVHLHLHLASPPSPPSSSSDPSFSLDPYPVPSPEHTQINRIIIDKGWICLFPPLPLAVAQYGQEGGSAQDQIISTPLANVIIACSTYLVMLNLMMIDIVSFWQ